MIRSIVEYSVDVVTIAGSKAELEQKLKQYRRVIITLANVPLDRGWPDYPRTPEEIKEIADEAAKAENLLDALGVAQPLIDDYVASGHDLSEQFDTALDEAVEEIENSIQAEHAGELEYMALTKALHLESLEESRLLEQHTSQEPGALKDFFSRHPEMRALVEDDPPSGNDILSLRKQMQERATMISDLREQVRPEIALYQEKLREMHEALMNMMGQARQARIALMAWDRGHARLAAGMTLAAEIDLVGIASRATQSAVKQGF